MVLHDGTYQDGVASADLRIASGTGELANAAGTGKFRADPAGALISMEPFNELVSMLDYPMYIVTTSADGEPAGCLVGFASQVSIGPPRFLVGLSKRNHTYRVAQHATHLAVHLVPRRHKDLARLFGSATGDDVDKFARCQWRPGPHDMPVLADTAGWFVGEVLSRYDLGDHVGFLTKPVDGNAPENFEQLVTFADVRDLEPGHEA